MGIIMEFEPIQRCSVPQLDEILGQPFKVLNDGFIRVVDYMGDDNAIVQAARVSYGKGTKKKNEDRGLIRYLMRHEHTSPFEMCELKLHIRVPMDAWRQWIRHRTANVNEYSTRYSLAIDAAQTTLPGEWRLQSADNKQGSDGFLDLAAGEALTQEEDKCHNMIRDMYNKRIDMGIAREQARKDLPLSTYTEAYWKIDLHNLLRFLRLRMDRHAQKEIRDYATIIGEEIVFRWVPHTWEAFCDYWKESHKLSATEWRMVGALMANDTKRALALAEENGWLVKSGDKLKRNRERSEFESILNNWGVTIPW
jgi:thymidylate synthase (FAD)